MSHATPDEVERGIALALEARRIGLMDDARLALVLDYYENEGARQPLQAAHVLQRLGGVNPARLPELLRGAQARGAARKLNDRISLLERVGEGGMGAVFRGYDRVLRRMVAVKLIHADRLESARANELKLRFEREATVMARIHHPSCVQIYDAGISPQGMPYLVMEYVNGQSLGGLLESDPQPDPDWVARWGKPVAEALQACHEAGTIHRDVKPANILMDSTGQPKLTDFGIALDGQATTRLTQEGIGVGTLHYLSPEQAAGHPTDARSDVYSLGASLYEALSGGPVFDATDSIAILHAIVNVRPSSLRKARPEIPVDLERVILKCLEKSPQDRYPTAQALALDLSRYLAGEPVQARPLTVLGRVGRIAWRRRRPLAAVAVLAVLLSATGVGWSWYSASAATAAARVELEAAEEEQDLDAAEETLTRLAGSADPALAADAQAALRRLRGKRLVVDADAAVKRYQGLKAKLVELNAKYQELGPASETPDPPEKNPRKREFLRVEQELAGTRRQLPVAFAEADRLLAQAALDLPGAEVARRKAALYLERGRSLEGVDFAAAEQLLSEAAKADKEAGGELKSELALPSLQVTCKPLSRLVLYRYALDPRVGVMTPTKVGEGRSPSSWTDLPPGEYLLEAKARGCLPARRPLLLSRGQRRELNLELPQEQALHYLAKDLVFLPGGTARFGADLEKVDKPVADFLMWRTEIPIEVWGSFLVNIQPPQTFWPSGGMVKAKELLSHAKFARWPLNGISMQETGAFLSWFQGELDLRRMPYKVDLPSREELAWAIRGEFGWSFPWGDYADGSFFLGGASEGRMHDVGSFPRDRSPFGVVDLAGSVSEYTCSAWPSLGLVLVLGGNLTTGRVVLRDWIRDGVQARIKYDMDMAGFRIVLRPAPIQELPKSPYRGRQDIEMAMREGMKMAVSGKKRGWKVLMGAIVADPEYFASWNARGVARARRGDMWGAELDYSRAIALAPKNNELYINRAGARATRRDLRGAIADYSASIKCKDTVAMCWFARGRLKLELGDRAGAKEDLQRAMIMGIGPKAAAEARRMLRELR